MNIFFYGTLAGIVLGLIAFWIITSKTQEYKSLIKNTFLVFGIIMLLNLICLFLIAYNKINTKILAFPDLRQAHTYTCGASALQTIFFYYGIDIREANLAEKLNTTADWGTEHTSIKKLALEYGFSVEMRQMTADDIKKFIDKNIPVILAIQAWADKKNIDYGKDYDDGHYVVAIGYNKQGFVFEDPSSVGKGFLTYEKLGKRWHDIDKSGGKLEHLGIAIYGKPIKYHLNLIEHIE